MISDIGMLALVALAGLAMFGLLSLCARLLR